MKLLCDLNISPATVARLNAAGHEAVRANERLPVTCSDSEVLALGRREGRVVVTHDLDFGSLLAASAERAPSVVILRLESVRLERVELVLTEALAAAADLLASGAIVLVEDARIRIRRLPLEVDKL